MNKLLKKILTVGISLLLLVSVGVIPFSSASGMKCNASKVSADRRLKGRYHRLIRRPRRHSNKRTKAYSWKYIKHAYYHILNAMIVPKPFRGEWRVHNFVYKPISHHVSYKQIGNLINDGSTRRQLTDGIKNVKRLHLHRFVKMTGHNRYLLYYDGYGIHNHARLRVHVLSHNRAYIRDYNDGHLMTKYSGVAHRY